MNPDLVTQTDEGFTSTNAYLAKSSGKYARSVANPLAYSIIFVLAMMLGGFLSAMAHGWRGGCTSGHMMSGMMQTALSGYIFTAGAFAAAIPVSILMFRKEA